MNPRRQHALVEARRLSARQHHLITRRQALGVKMTEDDIRAELAARRWTTRRPGIYRTGGSSSAHESRLMEACLVTGGWVSHEWAAWLWDLAPLPKTQPCVTVRRTSRSRYPGITVHRCSAPRYAKPPTYKNLPCSDRLMTVVEYATVSTQAGLDHAIDKGLSLRYFTVGRLLGELEAHRGARRRGAGAVRESLRRRGHLGAPRPSVLESRVVRLLRSAGIEPLRAEQPVWVSGHHYRLDFVLAEGLALEVDGFVYHGPATARHDHRRRNQIGNQGWRVLVYTWQDITEDGAAVIAEVQRSLALA